MLEIPALGRWEAGIQHQLGQRETLTGVGWEKYLRWQRFTTSSFKKVDSRPQIISNMLEIKGKEKKSFSTSRIEIVDTECQKL